MELSKEQIKKLIELSGSEFDYDNITQQQISQSLIMIERKLNFFSVPLELGLNSDINILIVDDLELSIYQFTQVLKKIGVVPSVARNPKEAQAEVKKKKFDYVIIDLYLPDLKDGLSLMEEMVKLKDSKEHNFKVIAISGTDNREIIDRCYQSNIDKFIPKSKNWHENVMKYIAQSINCVENPHFSKFIVNEDIIVYSLNKINSKKLVEEILKDINYEIALGRKNLILNFEKIKSFDMENVNLFTDTYKSCSVQGGKIILVSPSQQVTDVLEDIFLNDIIPVCDSIESAVKLVV